MSRTSKFNFFGTADIFRGIMVSLYVKGKENGHVQAYAPTVGNEAQSGIALRASSTAIPLLENRLFRFGGE